MRQYQGNIDNFGMDTISLAGPLKAKLDAIRSAGFSQVMLQARDLVGHAQGWEAAVQEVERLIGKGDVAVLALPVRV